jgi:hypothetical protein
VLASLGIAGDVLASDAAGLEWTHRREAGVDVYFLANTGDAALDTEVSLRVDARAVALWDALDGQRLPAPVWQNVAGRTVPPLRLAPGKAGSSF